MLFTAEIYLTEKFVLQEKWQEFITTISNYNGYFRKWTITVAFINNEIHYFVTTKCQLPTSINGQKSFLLKKSQIEYNDTKSLFIIPYIRDITSNAVDLKNYFNFRNNETLKLLKITIRKISATKILSKTELFTTKNSKLKKYRFILAIPAIVLSIDFASNYNITYKKAPQYLDINKCLHLLNSTPVNSILSVDTFPYLQGTYYLNQNSIDFAKHSIVFGSSGSGKSKLLSLLIENIYQNDSLKMKYKVVVIDPHAALENDVGALAKVVNFKNELHSINLFSNTKDDTIISVELLLDIFKGLLPNSYNSKLERVLRHALYLLLITETFSFDNLRKLLLDTEYRVSLIQANKETLPISIIAFFLTEFNDIKTKAYPETISPIIGLIDELALIPVFNQNKVSLTLKDIIDNNFLNIFSLDRTALGNNATKIISGLIMQQLLILIQSHTFNQHIIFIIDEVAVVENPILARFLSESRKYNLSLILAGQYFGSISEELKKAIFANVINYYIFRVSKDDANTLVANFAMKMPLADTKEEKVKLITELQDRECIIRIASNGCLLPAMKCKTLTLRSYPQVKETNAAYKTSCSNKLAPQAVFSKASNISLKSVLISNSTSRKVVEK